MKTRTEQRRNGISAKHRHLPGSHQVQLLGQPLHAESTVGCIHMPKDGNGSVAQRQANVDHLGTFHGNRYVVAKLNALRDLQQNAGSAGLTTVQRQANSSEAELIEQSMAKGVRNEVRLTDILFFARHPERNGRLIDPHSEADLVQEWLAIRNNQVRPTLASGGSAATDSNLVVKQEPVPPTVTEPAAAAAMGVPVTESPITSESTPKTAEEKQQKEETIGDGQHDKLRQLDEITESLRQMQSEAEGASANSGGGSEQKFWHQLNDTTGLSHYQEAGLNRAQVMAGLLRTARTLVQSLTASELGVEASNLERIKGHYNRLLNSYTPYFTQMANRNWLYTSDMRAWERTCNLTSLAMTLEAVGMQPKDFIGNTALLTQIAQRFESRFASFEDVAALRMPDFLQLVMIYVKFAQAGGNSFEQQVDQARRLAASVIAATLDIFAQVSSQFGVEQVGKGFVQSTGKLAKDENGGTVGTAHYQQAVLSQLSPWLDQGGQVVVNKPGHYVRLEDIQNDGLVIDDPAYNGKNFKIGWNQANQVGYFRSYLVFMKK